MRMSRSLYRYLVGRWDLQARDILGGKWRVYMRNTHTHFPLSRLLMIALWMQVRPNEPYSTALVSLRAYRVDSTASRAEAAHCTTSAWSRANRTWLLQPCQPTKAVWGSFTAFYNCAAVANEPNLVCHQPFWFNDKQNQYCQAFLRFDRLWPIGENVLSNSSYHIFAKSRTVQRQHKASVTLQCCHYTTHEGLKPLFCRSAEPQLAQGEICWALLPVPRKPHRRWKGFAPSPINRIKYFT
jgi:hypothetical protein